MYPTNSELLAYVESDFVEYFRSQMNPEDGIESSFDAEIGEDEVVLIVKLKVPKQKLIEAYMEERI